MRRGSSWSGSEVKSFREGRVQLRDAFARTQDGDIWLHGMHVSPYGYATSFGMFDPDRSRKLLLHRREIDELARKTQQGPLTLVPLSAYFKEGRAKIELALAGAAASTTSAGRLPTGTRRWRPSGRWVPAGCASLPAGLRLGLP